MLDVSSIPTTNPYQELSFETLEKVGWRKQFVTYASGHQRHQFGQTRDSQFRMVWPAWLVFFFLIAKQKTIIKEILERVQVVHD